MGRIQFFRNMKHKETDQILNEVLTSDAHMVQETLADLNRKAFSLAVDTILRSSDIYILGVRNSAPLAEYLAFYLNTIFPHVRLIHTNSASEIYEQMLHVGPKDVVIGISFPRYSMRILKALEFANSRNARVITLTDTIHSPINLYSSCNLLAKSNLSTIVDSMTAPMSLINALVVALCMKKKKTVLDNLEELDRVWDDYPVNSHDEINRLDEEIKLSTQE
ncbi:MAG: MurR/RpiR family transcriptional regulator [Lachnospiraceae bacterium]|nr:MurR/RpiR family transcriptional regulator [Lachnospiraceae bacterium]